MLTVQVMGQAVHFIHEGFLQTLLPVAPGHLAGIDEFFFVTDCLQPAVAQ